MSLPRLVLVHGALADGRMWSPHAPHLEARFRVCAPTLSGFGSTPPVADFGVERHAGDIGAELASQEEPALLVAWSYGALPALIAATRNPGRVEKLLLVETGHPGFLRDADLPPFEEDAGAFYGPIISAAGAGDWTGAARAMIDGSEDGAFDAQPAFQRDIQLDNLHSLEPLFSAPPPPPLDLAGSIFKEISVTVWWGERSRPVFRLPSRGLAEAIGSEGSGEIGGVNHLWPILDPEGFSEALARWSRA